MTNLKLNSTLLTITVLIICALTSDTAIAQSLQNITDTPIGIEVKAPHRKVSAMHFKNKDDDFLGGFQMRKNSANDYQNGLLDANGEYSYLHKTDAYSMFSIAKELKMMIYRDGKVVIGSNQSNGYEGNAPNANADNIISGNDYKLIVEKGILTEKVKVAGLTTADWADYVFEEDYEMLPIDELEDYVKENKHLPNVPSAQEVADNGLDLAKTDATLLEKIEESHLYIIELNNKFNTLQAQNTAIQTENSALKADLEAIKISNNSKN